MKIIQNPPEKTSPIRSLPATVVVDSSSGISTSTHRDVVFNTSATTGYHYEYTAFGADLPVTITYESVEGAVDISDWPNIRRNVGVNQVVRAQFANSVSTTEVVNLDFITYNGVVSPLPAHDVVANSLLEYQINAVDAVASAMSSNMMWDANGNRAQTAAIPHSFLTGHVWNGSWGPGTGAGTTPITGRRFMAITPRHLYSCGHYQYYKGQKVYFKDINNNVIERTVAHVVNLYTELPAVGKPAYDMSITLLDSDLPGSIYILPVAGAWASPIVSETAENFTFCRQMAGFILYNNDGHMVPFICADSTDYTYSNYFFTHEGINFDISRVVSNIGYGNPTNINLWKEPGKFDHIIRGGDSGSPAIIPCAEGWCYSSHVSQSYHPEPDLFNELIDLIDTRAVLAGDLNAPTNHTVTVATDPTL